MKISFLIIINLCLFFNSTLLALTFKSNGEVISSSGEVLQKSYAVQYQEALQSFEKGEIVEDWPVVELDKSGNPKKVQGYFGEKILIEGMPLFSTKKVDPSGDIMKNLSKLNGFIDDSMLGLTMIVNSNEDFRDGKDIDFNSLENTYNSLVIIGAIGQDLSSIENVAKEAGFGSAEQMYNEMGLNSADLDITNEAGKVDSPGVATDPNACNNNGGAC